MESLRYILDTHTFLWAVSESNKLSTVAKEAMSRSHGSFFVSSISAYEIMNKFRLGKLPEYAFVAENYLEILHQFGAEELPIKTNHAHYAGKFEWGHRDPFDRILAAQAFVEDLVIITNDSVFDTLPWLKILW